MVVPSVCNGACGLRPGSECGWPPLDSESRPWLRRSAAKSRGAEGRAGEVASIGDGCMPTVPCAAGSASIDLDLRGACAAVDPSYLASGRRALSVRRRRLAGVPTEREQLVVESDLA